MSSEEQSNGNEGKVAGRASLQRIWLRPDACLGEWLRLDARCCVDWKR